ncbi:O-antigen ligase family protein [Microbacterium sp. NPDC057650]|uniref:O-antigen ligase family protein n=1 Tax=unclassified Microbacterium TaxID=2609290 RepID=UPI00366AC157
MTTERAGTRELAARAVRVIDPVVAVQIYVTVLIASPAVYVVGPLGAAGTPATLVGCGLLLIWITLRLSRRADPARRSATRTVLGLFASVMLAAFAVGMLRPISAEEVNASVRGLISIASWCGVILFTIDASRTRGFVLTLARTVAIAGGVMAVLGIIQFYTGLDYVQILHLPGLVQNSSSGGLYDRSGFTRVSGTALHSIEFAAVLSICLPVSLYFALVESRRAVRWLPPAFMFLALLLTVSRSGAIGLGLGIVLAFVIANRRQRWILLAAVPFALVAVRLAIPGLVGTISNLFLGAAEDTSVSSRVDDYAAVSYYIAQSPWLGRGPSTFLPGIYRVLDNQYVGTLVEAGVLGLLMLILLFLVPMIACLSIWGTRGGRSRRALALSVFTSLAAAALLSVTFDMFGFPTAMGMTSVVIGLAAAFKAEFHGPPTVESRRATRLRRWVLGAVAAVLLVVVPLGYMMWRAEPVYEARGTVTVGVAVASGQNVYDERINSQPVPELMAMLMDDDQMRAALREQGVDYYQVALGEGSLAPFSDVAGAKSSENLSIATRAADVQTAARNAELVRDALAAKLEELQQEAGVRRGAQTIVLQDGFTTPEVFLVGIRRDYALAGIILSALVLTVTLAGSAEIGKLLARFRPRRRTHIDIADRYALSRSAAAASHE